MPSPGQLLDRSLPDTSGVPLVPDAPLVLSLVPVAPLVPPIVLPVVPVSPLPAGAHSVPLLPLAPPVSVPAPDEVPEVSLVEGNMPGGQTVVEVPAVLLVSDASLVPAAPLVPIVVSLLPVESLAPPLVLLEPDEPEVVVFSSIALALGFSVSMASPD